MTPRSPPRPDIADISLQAPAGPGEALSIVGTDEEGDLRHLYADPATGRIIAQTSFFNVQRFFRSFHRNLFLVGVYEFGGGGHRRPDRHRDGDHPAAPARHQPRLLQALVARLLGARLAARAEGVLEQRPQGRRGLEPVVRGVDGGDRHLVPGRILSAAAGRGRETAGRRGGRRPAAQHRRRDRRRRARLSRAFRDARSRSVRSRSR